MNASPNIVLVHGAWADGSSWSAVIERLQADGYTVTAPQFPLATLADDVARLRQVLARQDGPTIVVGHSYGGQIMTALGTDAPNVVGLVYIAAFGLDEGESIGALLSQGPPSPALAHLDIDQQGFAWLPEDDFVNHFAADVDPIKAKVMYAVQQPLAGSALGEVMGVPAWKSLPSWYLVADGDQAIPPDAERQFAKRMGATTVEVPTNHVAMVSHPRRRRKARQDRRRVRGGPRRSARLIRNAAGPHDLPRVRRATLPEGSVALRVGAPRFPRAVPGCGWLRETRFRQGRSSAKVADRTPALGLRQRLPSSRIRRRSRRSCECVD